MPPYKVGTNMNRPLNQPSFLTQTEGGLCGFFSKEGKWSTDFMLEMGNTTLCGPVPDLE